MRPIKLTISAFGSYPDVKTIDFTPFGDHGVFLITGDTGSGKTTIFDAITFALFGKATDSTKAPNMQGLRSNYAKDDTSTFVELIFKKNGKLYKVKRNTNAYNLYERNDKIEEGKRGAWINIKTNTDIQGNAVTLESLIGVDYKDFKQISMLAQGDFYDLVKAQSAERGAIFRKVFRTYFYGDIEKKVKELSQNAEEQFKTTNLSLKAVIDQLKLTVSTEENDDRKEELEKALQSENEKYNDILTDEKIEKVIELADKYISDDKETEKKLGIDQKQLDTDIEEKTKLITKAKDASQKRADLTAKKDEKKTLDDNKTAADKKLSDARSHESEIKKLSGDALILKEKTLPKFQELSENEKKYDTVTKDISDSQDDLEKKKKKLTELEDAKKKAEESSGKLSGCETRLTKATFALENAEKEIKKIDELSSAADLLNDSQKKLSAAQESFTSAQSSLLDARRGLVIKAREFKHIGEKGLEKNDRDLKAAQEKLDSAKDELTSLSSAETDLLAAKTELEKLDETKKAVTELSTTQLSNYNTLLKEKTDHYLLKVKPAYEKKLLLEKEYMRLLDIHNGHVLWSIADSLEPGCKCPVCGSLNHPSPAPRPKNSVSIDELEKAESDYKAAEKSYQEEKNTYTAKETKCDSTKTALTYEAKRLFGKDVAVDDIKSTADAELDKLNKYIETKEKDKQTAKKSIDKKAELAAEITQLESDIVTFTNKKTELAKALESRKHLCENAKNDLTNAISDIAANCKRADVEYTDTLFDEHIPVETDVVTGSDEPDTDETAADETAVDETAINAAKTAVTEKADDLRTALQSVDDCLTKTRSARTEFNVSYKNCFSGDAPESIGETLMQSIRDEKDEKQRAKTDAETDRTAAENDKKELARLTEEIAQTDKDIKRSNDDKNDLEKKISSLETEKRTLHDAIEKLKQGLDDFKDEKEVSDKIKELTDKAEGFQKDIDDAKALSDDLDSKISTLSGSIEQLEKDLENAVSENIDIPAEETALEKLKADRTAAIEKSKTIGTRIKMNKDTLASIKKLQPERSSARKKHEMLKLLSDTVTGGTLDNKERLSLETYVQIHYFDRVIEHANVHLRYMTGGQYELKRRETAGKANQQFGLDLDIIDNICADPDRKARSVNSISGGEKFKVALSLALGLSDELVRRSGGAGFDTLFIDEGFGTLDQESLNLAINVLTRLSADENRLIGIVSHVDQLKESIRNQIVITKHGISGSNVAILCDGLEVTTQSET